MYAVKPLRSARISLECTKEPEGTPTPLSIVGPGQERACPTWCKLPCPSRALPAPSAIFSQSPASGLQDLSTLHPCRIVCFRLPLLYAQLLILVLCQQDAMPWWAWNSEMIGSNRNLKKLVRTSDLRRNAKITHSLPCNLPLRATCVNNHRRKRRV